MRHSTRDPQRLSRSCIIIEAALEYFISILVTGAFLARITQSLGFSDSLTGILSSFVSLGCVFQLGAVAIVVLMLLHTASLLPVQQTAGKGQKRASLSKAF